jgi:hypothetical protein
MNPLAIKFNVVFILVLLIGLIGSCKKDDSGKMPVKNGTWSGTDISFTVSGDPSRISDLEFIYSGHTTGSSCSFDYESGASYETVSEVSGDDFYANLGTFIVTGTFENDTTAEIEISWTMHDSNCDADYSGNKSFTAFLQTTK